MFAAAAAFEFTRGIALEIFGQVLPDWAYTATGLTQLIVAAGAYRLALLWLRRLP